MKIKEAVPSKRISVRGPKGPVSYKRCIENSPQMTRLEVKRYKVTGEPQLHTILERFSLGNK